MRMKKNKNNKYKNNYNCKTKQKICETKQKTKIIFEIKNKTKNSHLHCTYN